MTICGRDVVHLADNGWDQRVKVVFPLPDRALALMPDGANWHARWAARPEHMRNPLRTYTLRAVRAAQGEADIDMVVHGGPGPAARWLATAAVGGPLGIIGPDRRFSGDHRGVAFRLPAPTTRLLLVADETAVPAALSIVERLPPQTRAEALLEVPCARDILPAVVPVGVRLTWLPRERSEVGAPLLAATLRTLTGTDATRTSDTVLRDDDVDVWDESEPLATAAYSVWSAGEAGVMRALRSAMRDLAADRVAASFMGYWRRGVALA